MGNNMNEILSSCDTLIEKAKKDGKLKYCLSCGKINSEIRSILKKNGYKINQLTNHVMIEWK
jgi:hypothetical protein